MYYCFNCGREYEMMPTGVQYHPYGEGYAPETVPNDMCSCGGDIVKVKQCKRCGCHCEPYEMYGDLCIKCDIEVDEEDDEWEE